MGIFDFLKKNKKEADYDPLNMKVTDLKTGFLFDYDLKSWEVVESYKYDWGDNFFSKEFKVRSSKEERFLHVETDDELSLVLYQKIKVRAIDEDLPEYIQEHEYPPKSIEYNGIKFLKEGENPGYFRNLDKPESQWTELISWDYSDERGEYALSIEQWGLREFEAAYGPVIKPFEISNIVPAEQQSKK